MKDTNEFEKNKDKSKNVNPHPNTVSIIEINGNYEDSDYGIDKEDILDVMGCKTRRENIGILSSSYKKILRGRPRKYYDLDHEVNIHITINKNTFNVNFNEDMLNTPQLPSGDEWSKLLDIEKRIDNGQTEAISELMNQIRLYENLKNRAEYILERTLKNK